MATNKAVEVASKAPGASREDVGGVGEAAKVLEVGNNTITIVDQVTSGVHEASGKASNAYIRSARITIKLTVGRGKAAKGARLKVMKVRQLALPRIKVSNTETYCKLLEEFMPSKYKKELL